ncbi:hypothetical protein CEJ98_20025 [Burkholderia gladioli pv. gladioli]|nr:hypothetical protein CEJ98_20025 [Burkholderia gladioli pv. gladioli]PRH34176.1 hypothetical protein C6V07_20085 [Burkholderia gladioli]
MPLLLKLALSLRALRDIERIAFLRDVIDPRLQHLCTMRIVSGDSLLQVLPGLLLRQVILQEPWIAAG